MEEGDFKNFINPDSLEIIQDAYIEPHLLNAEVGAKFQFIRHGYFCVDKDSKPDALVFNRTVTLKDSFKK
jgi:glutaminyl-tRNA synthetase